MAVASPSVVSRLIADTSARFPGTGVIFYIWEPRLHVLDPAAANPVAEADGLARRALGVGASGQAAARRAPLLITDYRQTVGASTPAGKAGVHAAIAVPLLEGDQLLGAVSVGTDDPRVQFCPADVQELHALVVTTELPRLPAEIRLQRFDALYEAHSRAALGLAARLLGNRTRAEEVVQDVFLSLWRTGAVPEPERGTTRTWILMMVRRRVIDLYRAHRRRPTEFLQEEDEDRLGGPDAAVLAHDSLARTALLQALEHLSVEQRETLELAYFFGLSHGEIATRLRLPVGTVKGRLRLALKRLRAVLPGE